MSQYTVLKCVPDTLRDECLNFGILTYEINSEGREDVYGAFITDWTFMEQFCGESVEFLKDFVDDIIKSIEERALTI